MIRSNTQKAQDLILVVGDCIAPAYDAIGARIERTSDEDLKDILNQIKLKKRTDTTKDPILIASILLIKDAISSELKDRKTGGY